MTQDTERRAAERTLPFNIEDHGDFIASEIDIGMRFDIDLAMTTIEDAEFCGLMTEGRAVTGMRFRVGGDTTMSLRWTEIDRLHPVADSRRRA